MYAIVNNGQVVGFAQVGQPFDCNGRRSARFLQNATEQECLDIGLYRFVEAQKPDTQFYWESNPTYSINEETKTVTESYNLNPKLFDDREESDQDGNPMYVKVLGEIDGKPAMVDSDRRLVTKGLKTIWTAKFKQTVNDKLKPTDSKVMDETITSEESSYRADVIAEGDRLDTAISSCTDVDGLINIVNSQNWPRVNI